MSRDNNFYLFRDTTCGSTFRDHIIYALANLYLFILAKRPYNGIRPSQSILTVYEYLSRFFAEIRINVYVVVSLIVRGKVVDLRDLNGNKDFSTEYGS